MTPTLDSLAAAQKRGPIRLAEACELLGVHRSTVLAGIKAGKVISPMRLGVNGTPRWPRAQFCAWMDHGTPSVAEWEKIVRSTIRGSLTAAYVA